MNLICTLSLLLLQYKTEKDGKVETRVEKKVVITDEGDDDDLDHDDVRLCLLNYIMAEIM